MKLPVLKIAALAMVTTVTGCGGGSDSEPAKALDLAKALLSKTDAAWATSVPTPSGVAALRDGCYVADGYNRTTATAAAETKLADYTASNAYRVGSKRQNVTVLSDDTTLNADKTERRLIKVRYSIAFADGSVDNKVEDTLVVGSSSGECATLTEVVGGKPAGIADCLVRIDPLKLWPNRAAPSGDGAGEW